MRSNPEDGVYLGGSVKAEGLGDGSLIGERSHRQAALDDATQDVGCHVYARVDMLIRW
jgi:hypothetical protein